MLRLKTTGLAVWKRNKSVVTGSGRRAFGSSAKILVMALAMTGAALGQATDSSSSTSGQISSAPTQPRPISQTKIALAALPTYDNKYELFGGLNFQNFQAGQALPKRMNLGGGEAMFTYWLNRKLGIAGDYRIDAGTTPVFANCCVNNRPLVYLNTFMGGVQYRGPKNQYVAVNYHALFGGSHGTFTYSLKDVPPLYIPTIGLYSNHTAPFGAFGGSIDFNWSKNWAVRVSPDLIIEHFGDETREFFGISGGVIRRWGKVK